MLTFPPEKRITAQAAYNHKWIQSKGKDQLDPDTSRLVLENLKNFHVIFIII